MRGRRSTLYPPVVDEEKDVKGRWMIQNFTFLRSLRKRPEVDGRKKSCPPHGPIQVQAVDEGARVASCLVCGLAGPKRENSWEAKLAFDEAFGTLPRTRN
jgi:hypothetical protein